MLEMARQGQEAGVIRSELDVTLLGYRLCQSMIHVGVGVSHVTPRAEHVPELRLRVLLHGIASHVPANGALDKSASVRAVQRAVREWGDETEDSDRTAHLRAVARKEFGRRGYEATTMRDIAASAGLSIGTVYREFSSKDELLRSIMSTYAQKVKGAWHAALRADASPIEKLDAVMLANIHMIERFSDEFRIQLAWLRQSPPTSDTLGTSLAWHLRQTRSLLAEGARTGDFIVEGPTADIRARCVGEALVSPPGIVQAGPSRAHSLARDTVLRGAIRPARRVH
jgi:AcrR family transcriptional regulator